MLFCGGTRRGSGWRTLRHKQLSFLEIPSPTPHLHPVLMPRGASVLLFPGDFSPLLLPLSSQKFLTLDFHGDQREVRTFGFLITRFKP